MHHLVTTTSPATGSAVLQDKPVHQVTITAVVHPNLTHCYLVQCCTVCSCIVSCTVHRPPCGVQCMGGAVTWPLSDLAQYLEHKPTKHSLVSLPRPWPWAKCQPHTLPPSSLPGPTSATCPWPAGPAAHPGCPSCVWFGWSSQASRLHSQLSGHWATVQESE